VTVTANTYNLWLPKPFSKCVSSTIVDEYVGRDRPAGTHAHDQLVTVADCDGVYAVQELQMRAEKRRSIHKRKLSALQQDAAAKH